MFHCFFFIEKIKYFKKIFSKEGPIEFENEYNKLIESIWQNHKEDCLEWFEINVGDDEYREEIVKKYGFVPINSNPQDSRNFIKELIINHEVTSWERNTYNKYFINLTWVLNVKTSYDWMKRGLLA